MTERMYGGYPESCVRDGLFQLEGEQVIAIVRDLLAENAALRQVLTRIKGHADFDGQDIAVVLMGRLETIYGAAGGALAATEGHSQGGGQ